MRAREYNYNNKL